MHERGVGHIDLGTDEARSPQDLTETGLVAGRMELGQFEAGRLRADLNSGTVVLDGGTRLKIVQGPVR